MSINRSTEFVADLRPRKQMTKDNKSMLSYYHLKGTSLKVLDLQKQSPDFNTMPGAGAHKKPPRMPERLLAETTDTNPRRGNLVFETVLQLSTFAAVSTESSQQTADTMGGTTVSPLLFGDNLRKMLAAANKSKQASLAAAYLSDSNGSAVQSDNKSDNKGSRHRH